MLFPLQSHYLGMSLQNMNQMRLVPKKDYVANRLVSGALQLAKNTSLYLDETQLEQGQLDTTGGSSRKPQEVDSEDSNAAIFPVLVTVSTNRVGSVTLLCLLLQVCVTSQPWGT